MKEKAVIRSVKKRIKKENFFNFNILQIGLDLNVFILSHNQLCRVFLLRNNIMRHMKCGARGGSLCSYVTTMK